MPEKEFYSTWEVARIIKVSPTTVFRAIDKKQLEASTTPGGHYRISRLQLERFLKDNNIPPEVLAPRTCRVLIVEDNPAELRLFERALGADASLEVRSTPSGYAAGFLTKTLQPDLIILDIFLGDADGREVARLIRQDPSLRATKLVAVSASSDPQVLREIREDGFDDFIPKPIQAAEFLARIKKLLR
jgi:excisionase family DNA binding protein